MTVPSYMLALWGAGDLVLAGLEALGWMVGLAVAAGIIYLVYLDVGSMLRRQERARCFLQLLEIGLAQGRSPMDTIISLSRRRVQTLGVYLHLLAAYLEQGLPLQSALERVPRFLPASVRAMLRVGEEIGDLPRVLPACRKTLRDGQSDAQSNVNNLVVVLFGPPVGAALVWICAIYILPKLKALLQDFELPLPPWTEQMFTLSLILSVVLLFLWLLFCLAGIVHAGGPAFVAWIEKGFWPVSSRVNYWLPWRHKAMQRDFSVMLSLLLDSGVPEEKAVRLAAEATANRVFIGRAAKVTTELGAGVKLTDAVRWLDDAGEFRWRLRNATEPRGGFFAALAGWHESLAARAFQQEQTVSQTTTTGFVVLNGLMAGLVATGIFRLLMSMVEETSLW